MTTLEVQLTLSEEVLEYLRQQATSRNVPLGEVVSEVLDDYLNEPTKEAILETTRASLREGLAGKVRPVDDVLAELKQELGWYADES